MNKDVRVRVATYAPRKLTAPSQTAPIPWFFELCTSVFRVAVRKSLHTLVLGFAPCAGVP